MWAGARMRVFKRQRGRVDGSGGLAAFLQGSQGCLAACDLRR